MSKTHIGPENSQKKSQLTVKQKEWVSETIATKNPTEAAYRAYDVKDRHNASVIASENLLKPYLREALNEMLENHNLHLNDTVQEHKWLIAQREHIATKFDAIKEHYELLGLHTKDRVNTGINIALVVRK